MFEDYFAKTNTEHAEIVFNNREWNDESTYKSYTDEYKNGKVEEKNPVARAGVTFTEEQQEKIKQAVKGESSIKEYIEIKNPTKNDLDKIITGDMVLIKSIDECNAHDWYDEAQNCCGTWITVMEKKSCSCCLYGKELLDEQGNKQRFYIARNHIQAIRKLIKPSDTIIPQVGDIIEWDNGELKVIIVVTEIDDSSWFKSNKESFQNKFIKKIICRLGENYLK